MHNALNITHDVLLITLYDEDDEMGGKGVNKSTGKTLVWEKGIPHLLCIMNEFMQ
jgi:hypothetical protein